MNEAAYEKIIHYHETTKHHYHRFARSLGYLDWDTQPNPFRFYQFFDDPVHQIMGLADNAYQSLYHFTIGTAIEDTRLTTYLPYHHLQRE